MCAIISRSTIFLFFLFHVRSLKCQNIANLTAKLDRMLAEVKTLRTPRDSEEISPIWQEYEFETGVGNREELVVANVTVFANSNLPEDVNWQFFETNGAAYLAGSEKSTLSFYKLNVDNSLIGEPVKLQISGAILTFRVIAVNDFQPRKSNGKSEIVVTLCVESDNGASLRWYRLFENQFRLFWDWPIQRYVNDLEFFRYGDENKLLLLNDNEMQYGKQYSLVYVYGFSIDFATDKFDFWLCQSIPVPKVFDIKVCSIYESIALAFQTMNNVFLYEFKDTASGGTFRELQTVKSNDLRNFVCFQSGYIQYLAISGPEAALFNFFENEFQHNVESESNFEIAEIAWIKDIRLDTYRDESLLLIQLRNSTVIALAWQGSGFKRISLPNNVLDQFELSRATEIPKFGFVIGNRFVKFDVQLKDFKRPIQEETERMLSIQAILNHVLSKQEEILDKTEKYIENSYLKNPVITGFWNLTNLHAANVTIENAVIYEANSTEPDSQFNVTAYVKLLENFARKIDAVNLTLTEAVDFSEKDVHLSNVEIIGNFKISTLTVKNLTVNILNGITGLNVSEDDVIHGKKQFPSVSAENLSIYSFNGIPVDEIQFGNSVADYQHVDFEKVKHVIVDGHLHSPIINNVNWDSLMKTVVRKDMPAIIPGNTVIDGTLVAEQVEISSINQVSYPDDFVLSFDNTFLNITGTKTFEKLSVTNLVVVETLNDESIADFVILSENNVLDKEITFEKLSVEGPIQVDGNVTGINMNEFPLLNETFELSSDIIFSNLVVLGNIILEESISDKNWSAFDDFLLKTDENPEITGIKTFLNDVEIKSNITIKSGMINGHSVNEFVTTNTEQEFPNLKKISADVTFGTVDFGAVEKLRDYLNQSKNTTTNCLEKIIVFKSLLTTDELSFDTVKDTVSKEEFLEKLNRTFSNVHFENLTLDTLIADQILPETVNGVNLTSFIEHVTTSNVVENYTVEHLEIDTLRVKLINGLSVDQLKLLQSQIETAQDRIFTGKSSLESLRVTGSINAESINGKILQELYKPDTMGTVTFTDNVKIENLTVLGLVNNLNFSERVSDAVLKTDRHINVSGRKIFDTINCHHLETTSLNGHLMENILDPSKEQVLTGPVIVTGSVSVLSHFDLRGKLGESSNSFLEKFKWMDKNTYEHHGDFPFEDEISILNLYVNGTIQRKFFDDFSKSVIFKNEDNVKISGTKTFENSVKFNGDLTITNKLNELDLLKFRENVVFIDKPFSVKSKIIFEDVEIQKNLIVNKSFETKTIMEIDLGELYASVVYLNQPAYITDQMNFTDAIFQGDIEVEKINDVVMSLLIPLHKEQTISVDVLKCYNVSVKKIENMGPINGYDLNKIKETTFMLIGDQNITGHINFRGNVYAAQNFDAHSINGVDPKQIVLVNTKETLSGNYVFKKQIILNQSLRTLGYLNTISPKRWQAVAVTTSCPLRQIISGKWTVHGNVQFLNGTSESTTLNGLNITETASAITQSNLEMDILMSETEMNLDHTCEELSVLQRYAENQIYKFNEFDYLQVLEFDRNIISVHYFDMDEADYLLLSYDSCHMHAYMFTGTKFELVANVPGFGIVDRWTTFRSNKILYFLTVGNKSCGRSPGNLWKLENDEFQHVLDLGNVTNSNQLSDDTFLQLINEKVEKRTTRQVHELTQVSNPDNENLKFILDMDRMVLTSRQAVYEYHLENENNKTSENYFRSPETLSFKVGIYEKELFLYYDKEVSENYVFICNNGAKQKKILQTIKVHRPKSFTVLNFDGLVETLLVFMENDKNLQIYEYKGMQGFVHRDTIKIDADKLFSFKIRSFPRLAKKHCLALIRKNRLTILKAKMHGEKLDMKTLSCTNR